MKDLATHTFHIPVLGLAYTVDTPVKVARFGISCVVSIIEDQLIEQMREFYCLTESEEYVRIGDHEDDYRARRITAYLNLLNRIVIRQVENLKTESFTPGNDIVKYFEMLPGDSPVRALFEEMTNAEGKRKIELQNQLRTHIKAGSIDVNIMTKLDRTNYTADGKELPVEYCDAMAALRGYAKSDLASSMVFSAGLNPRLYSYCESFSDFLPDKNNYLKKKIILKVSDYRSAIIQGKFLAKKGLWISEFRVESGLNCGGHAFATDGLLLGPILEEFKLRRDELYNELFGMCSAALTAKGHSGYSEKPELKITVQGGIGTATEDRFLRENYQLDGTGWGSPFLLVPEVTNVDEETLQLLAKAKQDDYFLSNASPLGIPFNNFRKSSSEAQRLKRITKGHPGSPCYKEFLASDTEFTTLPICTASRQYQDLKIRQIKEKNLPEKVREDEISRIMEKDCLCVGLGATAFLKNHLPPPHHLKAVTICPGPNLAFFSGIFSLEEMVGHIYGRKNILNSLPRPHMFVNELHLYVDYLKKEIDRNFHAWTARQEKQYNSFKENLFKGIEYYQSLIPAMKTEAATFLEKMKMELIEPERTLQNIRFPELEISK